MSAAAVMDRQVNVWQNKLKSNIKVAGSGSPVVFLHGAGGLVWDQFLDTLARRHTVYAPEFPGTTPGDPDAIAQIDNLWDLVLYYDELLGSLVSGPVPVIGHSFGAMLAAELAAHHYDRVSKLVLMCPIGLWREDVPIPNWMIAPPEDLPNLLLSDAKGPLAQQMFGGEPQPEMQIKMIWSMACTGKFIWPIPDKGLKKRIHRIHAPTLVLWGRQDRLVPVAYAQEFAGRIAGAKVELIDRAGHLLTAEHPARVAETIENFLSAG